MGKNAQRRRNLVLATTALRRVAQGDRLGMMFSLGRSHALSIHTERRRELGAQVPNRAERRRYEKEARRAK